MRRCYKCYEEKNDENFGKSFFCKECRNRIYFEKNSKPCPICKNSFLSNGNKSACSNICNIKLKTIIDENNCWIWKGTKDISGYGEIIDFENRKKKKSHRFTYELFKGEIPKDKFVLHKCDVRSCCNPDHLWIGNQSDNIKDATEKNRMKNQFQSQEGHWNHKLKTEEVREIKRLNQEGMKAKKLSEKFSVHVETIRDILKGRTWRHVLM